MEDHTVNEVDLVVDSILMLKKHGKLNVNEKEIFFLQLRGN